MQVSVQSGTLGSRVLSLLFLSTLSDVRGVDGLASKFSLFYDKDCEVDSGYFSLTFGARGSTLLVPFNECTAISDGAASGIAVCDVTTGETGAIRFEDGTCTQVESEEVGAPSCQGVDSSSSEECDNGGACSTKRSCTDDVPSTISPTTVNFFATEYIDEDCFEPTGNTEVMLGRGFVYGAHTDECVRYGFFDRHSMSECRSDGSTITQFFSPDDDTCSGEVWSQVNGPTEYAGPTCFVVEVGGFYYSIVSCTTDAATVWLDTPAPTFTPTEMDTTHAAFTPAPTTAADVNNPSESSAPTSDFNIGGTAETLSPSTDVNEQPITETPAPTAAEEGGVAARTVAPATGINDSAAADTTAPTTHTDDEAVAAATAAPGTDVYDDTTTETPAPMTVNNTWNAVDNTLAPVAADSRGIIVTAAPVAVPGGDEFEETTPPVGIDEAVVANGAIRGGNIAAFTGVVLSIAVGSLVCIAV